MWTQQETSSRKKVFKRGMVKKDKRGMGTDPSIPAFYTRKINAENHEIAIPIKDMKHISARYLSSIRSQCYTEWTKINLIIRSLEWISTQTKMQHTLGGKLVFEFVLRRSPVLKEGTVWKN
jgi:hypothetical protein